MENIYFKEIKKLIKGLEERGIDYGFRSLYEGYQVIVGEWDWDAICHEFSYGGKDGLLEVAGKIVRDNPDDVDGWLTAEEVLKRVDGEE